MAGLLQQLSGNPLATAIGQKIEQATDPSLNSEDWAVNMEICDMINDTDEGPRDAVRAIKKRLHQYAGKDHEVIMFTLTVLETCVKNCGKRFHLQVSNKDFIQDLVKLIGPKNDPPASLQERVLSLIQTWAHAFRNQHDLNGVYQVYCDLKTKGIEFPSADPDSMAPIHTPQRSSVRSSHSESESVPVTSRPAHRSPSAPTGPVKLNSEQLAKLQSELDVVQGNMRVFGEMLDELTPGKEHTDDWELLKDLNSTCESMQKRIVELIEKVANEEVTIELLRINDELNTLFIRYGRFVKKKSGSNSSSRVPVEIAITQPTRSSQSAAEASLIDLDDLVAPGSSGDPNDLVSRINSMTMQTSIPQNSGAGNDDFDDFAQSRSDPKPNNIQTANAVPPTSQAAAVGGAGLDELDEMERWLHDEPEVRNSESSSLANADFERFLAQRAMAADRLPDRPQDKKSDPFGL
ncbi:TOM1-like protein 2 [Halotydeus destructor]|nr:TOM1-like protein 2 [Halotydeus destructor]